MQGAQQLLEWWNLPFTAPFALAVIYVLLTATGVVDVDQSDATDATDHGDLPDLPAAGTDTSPESPAGRALDLLGLGRIPLAIVIQVFFLVWGFAGWAATSVLRPLLGSPLLFFPPALLIAAVCGVGATVFLARPLARWLPSAESHAPTKHGLAGRIGVVVFPVGSAEGTVHVRDDRGNLHQIACRLDVVGTAQAGPTPTIPKGSEVIVVSYDDATGRYLVVPSDLPAAPALPARHT